MFLFPDIFGIVIIPAATANFVVKQNTGVMLEVLQNQVKHRMSNGLEPKFSCNEKELTRSRSFSMPASSLPDMEWNAIRHCIPGEEMLECYEDPPCVSDRDVLQSLSSMDFEYIVIGKGFSMKSALIKSYPNNSMIHFETFQELHNTQDILTCQPSLDVLRLSGFTGAIYLVDGHLSKYNFTIVARKQGLHWDQEVVSNHEVITSHDQNMAGRGENQQLIKEVFNFLYKLVKFIPK